jgi:ubiquinol-cytochrome c reductase cytochrome b subunit
MEAPPPAAPPAKQGLGRWIETRFPLAAVIRWSSVEGIAGGSRFSYALGSTTLALFLLLVITGIWQLLYYVPTVDHAYTSLMYLRLQVPLGWLVHGLHYWSAQAFIVVMGLHVLRVFVWAAYKKPRELIWLLGVVLLLLGAAFIFTGAILPWDSLGFWAGEVGTSMAGTVPLIGNFLKLVICGGDAMGQMTLSRAFTVHVAILPILTGVCIALHLVAFRQFGSIGPWNPTKRATTGWFWPDQTFKDLLVVSAVILALIVLSAFVPAPISGPADPLDSAYIPKPEWNFLFLYEALKAFKGRWEWIGTVAIPAALAILLFALPFIDRNEERNPFRRPIAMGGGFLFVTTILVLTFIGYRSHSGAEAPAAGVQVPSAQVVGPADHASPPAAEAAGPAGPVVKPWSQAPVRAPEHPESSTATVAASAPSPSPAPSDPSVRDGRSLFMSVGCIVCHKIDGAGGTLGPDLSHEALLGRTSAWLDIQINDPVKHASPTIMPAYAKLTTSQVKDLADFILAVRAASASSPVATSAAQTPAAPPPQAVPGSAAPAPGAPRTARATVTSSAQVVSDGKPLFTSAGCAVCHKIAGAGGVLGPDLSHEAALGRTSQWLIDQITDPRKHAPLSIMPATTTLTPAQLTSMAGFILGAAGPPAAAAAAAGPQFPSPSPSPSTSPSQFPSHPGTSTMATPVEQAPQQQGGVPSGSTPAPVSSETTVRMIGDPEHGAILFAQSCAQCHGSAGVGHIGNPGALAGVISPLAPIGTTLFNEDPVVFAGNIDLFIQHGATPPGPHPALIMPAFGATHSLTDQMITNIEAYVLALNGVDEARIVDPGITPAHAVEGATALFVLALAVVGVLYLRKRT